MSASETVMLNRIAESLEAINEFMEYDIYSVDEAGQTAFVFANSGPGTGEYMVYTGTFKEASVFLVGVMSGLNTSTLKGNYEEIS